MNEQKNLNLKILYENLLKFINQANVFPLFGIQSYGRMEKKKQQQPTENL